MKRKILFKCFDNNTISLGVQDNKYRVFNTLATFNGNSIHCDGIDILKNEPVPDNLADYWHVEMYDFGNAVCVFDLDTDKYDKPLIRRNCLSPETISKMRDEVKDEI